MRIEAYKFKTTQVASDQMMWIGKHIITRILDHGFQKKFVQCGFMFALNPEWPNLKRLADLT